MGGTYSWNDMPSTFSSLSLRQREAIGKLCYDFGVATYMDWDPRGSGTGGFCLDDAFTTVFGYANSRVYAGEPGGAFSQDIIERTVLANLDAGCPVALGLDGHEVVADGYGYASGTLYTHLNIGWNGDDDAWYHLPVVDGYTYRSSVLDEVVYNVFPEKTGDLLTGRVLDESGQPVAGATVSAGEAMARTNGKGIWALWIEGGATWDVEARMGDLAAGCTVDVGRSVSSRVTEDSVWERTGNPGNSWGNDIVLPGLVTEQPLPVFRFYSKNYRGHFFTIDEKEKNILIATNPNWKYEGEAYRAFMEEAPGTTALYRFYSKGYRGHFFTVDAEEAETVKKNPNWKYEGIAYYVYPEKVECSVPVFRFWSKAYRHHFYTTDEAEKDTLIATNPNWKYETVAFWALPAEDDKAKFAMRKAQDAMRNAEILMLNEEPDAPGFALETEDGERIATPGVAKVGNALLETRGEAPDAAELASHAESAAFKSHAESAENAESSSHAESAEVTEALPFRLALPTGVWSASLWSAAEGMLEEEEAKGSFDFALPATSVWHWLRVRDAADEDADNAFSLWLRAE